MSETTSMVSEGGICESIAYSMHRVDSGSTYFITTPEHARVLARDNGWSAELLARVLEAHERQMHQLARNVIENGL